jgi:nucleoid-associated protein YgaU
MQKDFKIGLFVGLILVIMATLWLATRPSLALQARLLRSQLGSGPLPARHQPKSLINTSVNTLESQSGSSLQLPNTESGRDGQLPKIESQPTVQDMAIYEQTEKIKTQRFHIVRQGDTLSAISQKYYGSKSKWRKILHANRSQISDANKLKPGTKLIIPD